MTKWTQERIDYAKNLWGDGLSAAEVALQQRKTPPCERGWGSFCK